MTFVVAPAVVAAGRTWVWILRRYRGRAAIRYLRLIGFVGTLVGLGRSWDLVHTLLRSATAAATAAARVMHRVVHSRGPPLA